jgi:hypothetical protein
MYIRGVQGGIRREIGAIEIERLHHESGQETH